MACPTPPLATVCRGAAEARPPRVMCPPPRPSCGRAAAPACPRVAAPLLPALMASAPSPVRGSRRAHRPSEGHSAPLLLQPPPPPPKPADTVDPPPQHLGMPLVMAATTMPHPPVPLAGLACGGPVLITQGLHRAPWLPYSFPPHPLYY